MGSVRTFLSKENAFVGNGNSKVHVSESVTIDLLKCLFPFCFYPTDDGDSIIACSGSISHDDCFSLESNASCYSDDDALHNGSTDNDELLYGESIWFDEAHVSELLVDEFQLRGSLAYLPKSPARFHSWTPPPHATRVNTASTRVTSPALGKPAPSFITSFSSSPFGSPVTPKAANGKGTISQHHEKTLAASKQATLMHRQSDSFLSSDTSSYSAGGTLSLAWTMSSEDEVEVRPHKNNESQNTHGYNKNDSPVKLKSGSSKSVTFVMGSVQEKVLAIEKQSSGIRKATRDPKGGTPRRKRHRKQHPKLRREPPDRTSPNACFYNEQPHKSRRPKCPTRKHRRARSLTSPNACFYNQPQKQETRRHQKMARGSEAFCRALEG
jgi:hypothetical protein